MADEYRFTGGSLTLDGDTLLLRRGGLANFGQEHAKGTRRIPLAAVKEVRYKKAGWAGYGYLHLVLPGSKPLGNPKPFSAKHPDTIEFKSKDAAQWSEAYDRLKAAVAASRRAGLDPASVAYDPAGPSLTERAAESGISTRGDKVDLLPTRVIWLLFGTIGAHRWWMGRGFLRTLPYSLTLGYLLVGWLYDGVTLRRQVQRHNERIDKDIARVRAEVAARRSA